MGRGRAFGEVLAGCGWAVTVVDAARMPFFFWRTLDIFVGCL